MTGGVRHRRDERDGGGPEPITTTCLPTLVQILGPVLWMYELPGEALDAGNCGVYPRS